MNIQNLISQMANSSNPMQMILSLLSPDQKAVASQFQNKTSQEQAEQIAKVCNEKGISKEQLQEIINAFKR